ncbi:predicted protein [Naegleria gruberi]|uniref:Predicted protein n=1 Tax=Naegleria gruberi TaxID=5762 RepID=D2VHX6_NAEGR|nr:uncharacterized protein NAEGRDRAFT_68479 [Naegleria gruberi]EFC43417.1 predicted protein [Naegleria gruberi]|eukprot:XP_002676161.1 predicted protein [Naegleria gruberi strain NEG-M]
MVMGFRHTQTQTQTHTQGIWIEDFPSLHYILSKSFYKKSYRKLSKYIDTYGRKRRGWKRFGKKRIIRKKIDVYGKKRRFNKRRIDTYRKKNRKNRRGDKKNKKVDIYKRK